MQWDKTQANVLNAISVMMAKHRSNQNPRELNDPHERAYRWWRLAMNRIKENNMKRKKLALGNVRRLGGGDDLDEMYDSEEHEHEYPTTDAETEDEG